LQEHERIEADTAAAEAEAEAEAEALPVGPAA
jgi:hypothetical protein